MAGSKSSVPRVRGVSEYLRTVLLARSKPPIELTTTHSLRLGKDELANYQIAFEHSATAHPEEWHRCCEWIVARIAERAQPQQPHPQTFAQSAAPRE